MTVGDALKRFRKQMKLSQTDVAERLGMLQQTYSRYESGKFSPRADDLIKLADAYDVTTDYLLGRSDEPRPPKFDEKTLNLIRAMQAFQSAPAEGQVPAQ